MIYNRVTKTRMTIDAFDDDAGNSCYRKVTIRLPSIDVERERQTFLKELSILMSRFVR